MKTDVQSILQNQYSENAGDLPERLRVFHSNLPESNLARLHTFGDASRAGIAIRHEVFRIIQEFVQNTMKHSANNGASIELHFHPNSLEGLLRNSGKKTPAALPQGLGLENIQLRVRNLGGKIENHKKGNFSIHFSIPYDNIDASTEE